MTSPASSPLRQIVAANIDKAITESGRTNRDVGESIGSTEHQVWRWRKGHRAPSHENLAALAAVLAKSVAWFYTEHDDELQEVA